MTQSFVPISELFIKYDQEHRVGQEVDGDRDAVTDETLGHVLDTMFEPRTWQTDDGERMQQFVSRVPSNRQDAIALQSLLDMCLQRYQARETGLCPIRRTLYDRAFDELIRQVTVNCVDQGLLLFRVCNELRMTLSSYKTMYESCLHFGLRFALHNQKRSLDLEVEKEGMAVQQDDLRRRHFQLTKLHEATLGQSLFVLLCNLFVYFVFLDFVFVSPLMNLHESS
jgi:dynein light intermediate chain